MRNSNRILASLFILTIAFTACKKYEEGPKISLRSRLVRASNNWNVDRIVDPSGTDVAAHDTIPLTIEINRNGAYIERFDSIQSVVGSWEFINKEESIHVHIPIPFLDDDSRTYRIVRLKEDEMKMRDANNYVYFLSPAAE